MFAPKYATSTHEDKYSASLSEDARHLQFPHRLNFYDKPPLDDITLEDFEVIAIDRLRILAEIEASFVRNRPYDDLKQVVKAQCDKHLPMHTNSDKTRDLDGERKRDLIGHFVLRLAFCRSEELRRRFVKAETSLFRVRYDEETQSERERFLASRDFGWTAVSEAERAELKDSLALASPSVKNVLTEQWYKVKWTRVPDLVEKRRVFLKGGWAYVPGKEQSSIVFQEFQTRLEAALDKTAKALPRLDEDTRIMPILSHLGNGFLSGVGIASEYTSSEGLGPEGEVRADMIDEMAHKHWPLCMRNLHDNLRRDRHLKHFGRLQYGLFLKVVGLSIEEAIVFWRKAFNNITDDKFNKEYKYNIRHSYGLEGKRTNYPAYTCQRIMTSNQPGPTDCHGCPYRHFSEERLKTALLSTYSSQGLTSNDLPEIMKTVNGGHYHVACTAVFEVTHGIPRGQGLDGENVTHPNQYAAKSREMEKAKADNSKTVKGEKDVVMA